MSARFAARLDIDLIGGELMLSEGVIDSFGAPGGGPCSVLPAGGGADSVWANAGPHTNVKAKKPDTKVCLNIS
jgi:hypothetical protein